jgi:FixJ family two-component response regulator
MKQQIQAKSNRESIVFVVDDDPSVRRSLGRLLKSAGHRIELCASAGEFLQRERLVGTGCLVLDVQLPGLDGLELQQVLNSTDCPLPIIFITGHGDIPMSVRAMKAGAVDFLAKPFVADALLHAVAQALEKSERTSREQAELKQIQQRLATLTPREHQVLQGVIAGKLNKQIANDLGTVEKTVKVHRGRVMGKMRVLSVAELVRQAEKAGINPET